MKVEYPLDWSRFVSICKHERGGWGIRAAVGGLAEPDRVAEASPDRVAEAGRRDQRQRKRAGVTSGRSSLEDEFLTVAQVAEILQLNQQTVRNWIDQGSLPAVRVGRRVRIRRSELEGIIEQSRTTARPKRPTGPSAEDFWGGTPVGLAEAGVPEAAAPEYEQP